MTQTPILLRSVNNNDVMKTFCLWTLNCYHGYMYYLDTESTLSNSYHGYMCKRWYRKYSTTVTTVTWVYVDTEITLKLLPWLHVLLWYRKFVLRDVRFVIFVQLTDFCCCNLTTVWFLVTFAMLDVVLLRHVWRIIFIYDVN